MGPIATRNQFADRCGRTVVEVDVRDTHRSSSVVCKDCDGAAYVLGCGFLSRVVHLQKIQRLQHHRISDAVQLDNYGFGVVGQEERVRVRTTYGGPYGMNPAADEARTKKLGAVEQMVILPAAAEGSIDPNDMAMHISTVRDADRRLERYRMGDMSSQRPHKPILLPSDWDGIEGAPDPAERTVAAHSTAAAVVKAGRETADPQITLRLVRLVETVGLDELADLWRDSPEDTLPGTLWQLYLLRTWVQRNGIEAARLYEGGRRVAEVSSAVAGVAEPPGPAEVAALGDAVLTSAFDGDFAIALERAAAFCRVVAVGRARLADDLPDADVAHTQTRLAAGNIRMAQSLEHAAELWRRDLLT
jgi:hypothetical protein